jgi:hypothetical protein
MKKFRRFLINQMDICKESGLGSSVWTKTDTMDDATVIVLHVGKKEVAGVRIEHGQRTVTVPEMRFSERVHPCYLSKTAKEIIEEIESYVV